MRQTVHLVSEVCVLAGLEHEVLVVGVRLRVRHDGSAHHDGLGAVHVVTVARHEGPLVGNQQRIHLLIAPYGLLEVNLHLVDVVFKPLQKFKRLHRLRLEPQNLVVLVQNLRVVDFAEEGVELLDAV